MTKTLISPRALEILRLITPEWMKLDNRNMQKIPEMKELYFLKLIEYEYYYGECRVRLMPNAVQFVPEYFN